MNYQVDDLSIDVGQRQVSRGDDILDIGGLTFDLFLAIVEAAPNIISSDELVEKVWSGRPTSPETITQRAMMLRQALGDDADHPRYIEVVRGQGLKLVPKVNSSKTRAKLNIPKPLLKGAALVALVIAAGWVGSEIGGSRAPLLNDTTQIRRHSMDLGDLSLLGNGGNGIRAELAVSPDGSRLVYVANSLNGETLTTQLFVRKLGQLNSQPIEETYSARHPFFSPDGQWIGFDANGGNEIHKISVRGGLKKTLTGEARRMYGATWSKDGTIVYSTTHGSGNQTGRLLRIPDNGGEAEEILVSDGDLAFTWPHFLPGDKHLLFSAREVNTSSTGGSIELLSLESGEYRTLIEEAHHAKYSPTGHIVYARGDTVWAVPFDLGTLQITGSETPIFDNLEHNSLLGDAVYDFSDDGLLVYMLGGEAIGLIETQLAPVWVDRHGNEESIDLPAADYSDPHISSDGTQALIVIDGGSNDDIWTIDLRRATRTRLTFGPNASGNPIWSLDGEQMLYRSSNDGGGIFTKPANGTGTATLINQNNVATMPKGISPDGKQLLVMDQGGGETDMYVLSAEGESFPQPYITTAFDEGSAELSPDGRFVVYSTDESGRNEIEVRPFPNPDKGRWQVSTDGGNFPKWSANGSELFYRDISGSGSIYVVNVATEPEFSVGEPQLLISGDFESGFGTYAVHPDGQRFMMFRAVDSESGEVQPSARESQLVIVENWFEELKKIRPTD